MRMHRHVALALWMLCGACGSRPPAPVSREITGTVQQRISAISALLGNGKPIPSPLRDAYFVEDQLGDGRLGPSDFQAFYRLTVAPTDLAAWRAALSPLDSAAMSPSYVAPRDPRAWWLSPDEFKALTFYSSAALTVRANGWIGVHPVSGVIYIFTYTQ
jgi:hypothetical protein